MHTEEAQQLLLDIIEQAQSGQGLEFQYIRSWSEFIYRRRQLKSTKFLIRTLEISSKKLFKSYCKDVIAGISDINKLLAYSQLRDVIAFYRQDLETLECMLKDYDIYLIDGNFWQSFLGGERVV